MSDDYEVTDESRRVEKLLAHGVPLGFLDWQKDPVPYAELRFNMSYPKSAYWYVSDGFSFLHGWEITPVSDAESEPFIVMRSRGNEHDFIEFHLESDEEETHNFGSDFRCVLAYLLLYCRQFSSVSDLTDEDLIAAGESFGLAAARHWFEEQDRARNSGELKTYEDDVAWIKANVNRISSMA